MWFNRPIDGDSLPAKKLCLTFDDGPGRPAPDGVGPRTVQLAEYLAAQHVPATFFVVGKHAREAPGDIERIRDLGHTVGNHSWSHRHLTGSFLSVADIIDEVTSTDAELGAAALPIFFRPPYGAWSPRLAHFLNLNHATRANHIGPVNWNIGGFDFQYWRDGKAPESCATAYMQRIRQRRKQNGIVLFHDRSAELSGAQDRNRTFEMIRILVPRLRDDGFAFTNLRDVPEIRNLLQPDAST